MRSNPDLGMKLSDEVYYNCKFKWKSKLKVKVQFK